MAPRVKPTTPAALIKDPGAVNAALGELSQLKRELSAIDLEMNEQIDQLKGKAELKKKAGLERVAALEAGLVAYGEFNKDLFEEKRSHQYTFGRIGWRRATELKPVGKTTWKEVQGALRKFQFVAALRTKEEVDKEELLKWPAERLELVGVVRQVKDTFFYELETETTGDAS